MNLTSVDPPEVIRFVKREYPEVELIKPKASIYQIAVEKTLPSVWRQVPSDTQRFTTHRLPAVWRKVSDSKEKEITIMQIYAKQGTALEQTIKAMCDKIKQGFDKACDMTEQMTGARPISPAYIYHWGTIMKFVPEFTFKPEDEDKIDLKVLRPIPKVRNGWKPNLRTKAGNEFRAAFYALAEEWEVTEDALHKFGIHMTDFNKGVSHYIRPLYDPERKQYYLDCSNSVPEAFDKKKLAKDQFDIEYE